MVNHQFLQLRNILHEDTFRFDMPPRLWKTHYITNEKAKVTNVLRILQNGALKGYAIYSPQLFSEGIKAYKILEICAQKKDVLTELIEQIIERALEESVDFIYFRESNGKFSEVLTKKGFFSFLESAIMVVLLNPQEFFSSLSEEVDHGKTLKLLIRGFDPILLRVGKKGIMVVSQNKPDLTITIDVRTFLNLLFGKTSFFRQLFRGRASVSSLSNLPTAFHFFSLIKQKKWYIPSGDWL